MKKTLAFAAAAVFTLTATPAIAATLQPGPQHTRGAVDVTSVVTYTNKMPQACRDGNCAPVRKKYMVLTGEGRCIQRAWVKKTVNDGVATVKLRVEKGTCDRIDTVTAGARITADADVYIDGRSGATITSVRNFTAR